MGFLAFKRSGLINLLSTMYISKIKEKLPVLLIRVLIKDQKYRAIIPKSQIVLASCGCINQWMMMNDEER